MVDFEAWKDEIIDSIEQLHEETKQIREYYEEEREEKNTKKNEVEELQEVLDDEDQEVHEDREDHEDIKVEEENEMIIIEKLDEINESISTLNKTVAEGSIVLAITIVIALAFHYFVSQISKW